MFGEIRDDVSVWIDYKKRQRTPHHSTSLHQAIAEPTSFVPVQTTPLTPLTPPPLMQSSKALELEARAQQRQRNWGTLSSSWLVKILGWYQSGKGEDNVVGRVKGTGQVRKHSRWRCLDIITYTCCSFWFRSGTWLQMTSNDNFNLILLDIPPGQGFIWWFRFKEYDPFIGRRDWLQFGLIISPNLYPTESTPNYICCVSFA